MKVADVQNAIRIWAHKTNVVSERIAQSCLVDDGALGRVQAAFVVIDETDPQLAVNAAYLFMTYARAMHKTIAKAITPDMSVQAIQLEKEALMARYRELCAMEKMLGS